MKVNKEILSIYEEILTNNKNLISELNLVKLNTTNYSNLKYDTDGTAGDSVNKALLDDLNAAAKSVGIIATITTAATGHPSSTDKSSRSRHPQKTAVDIALLDGEGSGGASSPTNGNQSFRSKGNKLKDALVSMGYSLNVESGNDKAVLWQTNTGGNHFNHLHVSNNSGESSGTPTNNTQSTDNSSGSAAVSGASRDPMVSNAAGDIFGKVLGVTEQKTRKTKYFITFCNISDLKNYRNGQEISNGDVIGRTNTDVNVSKYDENYSKINLTEKEFRLGKDVNYSFGNATIPFSKNDKIKSPISGIVNNSKYISNCKNQLTIEVSGKIDIDNKLIFFDSYQDMTMFLLKWS
jgi:hypothetical protein